MPFHIPTLEEARKKQEDATTPRFRRTAPSTPSSSSTSAAPPSSSSSSRGGLAAPAPPATKRAALANPYAKKKSTVAAGATKPSAAAAALGGQPQRRPPPSQTGGRGGAGPIRATPPPLPPPPDVGPCATFSQAFGSVEDTDHFREGADGILLRNDEDDSAAAQERAEQRAFDAKIAESVATEEKDTGASGATSLLPSSASARDNHALLQPHVLHVSTRQKGNGILRFIRNVPFAYAKMVPDYIMGPNRCALFLSCKYHSLHPTYIHRRISELKGDFDLRVLLCLVDVEDNASTLLALNKLCCVNDLTLILSWSEEEAARYLETFKAFESKDASSIQRREQTTYPDQVADVLSAVRSVNKTDAAQLLTQFGSLKSLVSAPMDELSLCPGVGPKKVRRLYEAFHKPFSSAALRKRRRERQEKELEQEKGERKNEKVVPVTTEEGDGTVDEVEQVSVTGAAVDDSKGETE